ncbi:MULTISPECIES: anti-CBASS protein Acb1 family protein [Rhizobium/Agrobacterium group]|uniref:anti-CBASS protein Acb1 family protein n=1 Tax=Rhizobium oryzihabitans TaxID=2267833 RepID=UPI0040338145
MMLLDRLSNFVSGLGTSKDKKIANVYGFNLIDAQQLNAMHRSDWMARKVVDIIPDDMTREWREWQADESVVEAIERTERAPQINIQAKVNEAMQLARLRGGAVLVLGIEGAGLPNEELAFDRVKIGSLKYVHVLGRDQVSYTDINRDITSPFYGEPVMWTVSNSNGAQVDIHPSRVIRFVGAPILDKSNAENEVWGDSVLQIVYDAIQNAASSQEHTASLIPEAKTDVIYIPNLSKYLENEKTTQKLTERFTYANTMKSMFNMLLLEGDGAGATGNGERWEQKTINFGQFPELLRLFLQVAAGAADIPLVRFLQDAPSGLGSNGETTLKNYYDNIGARQTNWLGPAMWRFDEVCIRSATGKRDPSIYYQWAPLYTQTEKERAEVFKMYADGARTLVGSGTGQEIIARDAVSQALINRLVEDGNLPGLAEAVEEFGAIGEQEPTEEELAAAAGATQAANTNNVTRMQQAANDAAPRTLYVSRKVVNAADLIEWAKGQGFKTTLPADEMHVTIAYSRDPVDWMKVGESWASELKVAAGGPRLMERFGEARVLLFKAAELDWRHENIKAAGASWDHSEYQSHITISYDPESPDLESVEPYQGEIILGPELFAEVKEDWQAGISEG